MDIYTLLELAVGFLGVIALAAVLCYNTRCVELSEQREARRDFADALPWADPEKLILDAAFQPIIVARR